MAKSYLRLKAREMRSKGESVKVIAKILDVSKGTVSLWVRDIILSVEQLEKLHHRLITGGELGRLKGSLMQKERRLRAINSGRNWGVKKMGELSDREFFLTGVALYWAEGTKKKSEVSICNSDPKMINFIISWLRKFFLISKKNLRLVVGINQIHKGREDLVKKYWSEMTSIPIEQFRKTSFKKTNSKKIYTNFNEYYGTLSIKVLKSAGLYYKIMGLVDALARQGSSVG